jgi:4-carboxymuconolactone decarboxylase
MIGSSEGISELVGSCPPKLVSLTNDVVFNDIWQRPQLSKRDRSLITIAALIANGTLEELPAHVRLAGEHGITRTELDELIVHIAVYAGWPRAVSAARSVQILPDNEHELESTKGRAQT